jgi:hypothetical protein
MTMSEDRELEQHRDQVRGRVFAGIARRRVIRQRRLIGIIAGSAVVLAAGVGLGAAKLVTQAPEQRSLENAACYASDDTSQPQYFINADGTAYDVVALCQEMWLRGQIGQTPPPADPNDMSGNFPVPDIALCVDGDGYVSGFPIWDDAETAQQLCDRLGLPAAEPEPQP